jgi:hypothetical protein
MRNIKAFKDLSDFMLGEICVCLRLQRFDANMSVFSQGCPFKNLNLGDIGTAWYIILSGSCKVLITKVYIHSTFRLVD